MKKIALLAAITFSLFAGFRSEAKVNINIQVGAPVTQQSWYANDNDYYYMPQHGVYYNVRRDVYVYQESGRWLSARRLPARFGAISYRNTRYVQVRDRSPFNRDHEYRRRYAAASNSYRSNDPHEYNRPGTQRSDRDRSRNDGRSNQGYGYNRSNDDSRGQQDRRYR